jgi:hypothetical protein
MRVGLVLGWVIKCKSGGCEDGGCGMGWDVRVVKRDGCSQAGSMCLLSVRVKTEVGAIDT